MMFLKPEYNNEAGRLKLIEKFQTANAPKYGYNSLNLYDWKVDTAKKQQKNTRIATIVTSFVVSVTTIFSMIPLYVTIKANIIDQLKELVVLRGLGIKKLAIKRIYIYESVVTVLTSSFIGMITGLLVTIVIVSQNSTWGGAVPVYKFPWPLFGVSIGFSLPFSIFYTYYMISRLIKIPIAKLMRSEIGNE